MSDRTSAELFGMFFNFLAKNPNYENKKFALKLWKKISGYDFSTYQMYVDKDLVKLGLARSSNDGVEDRTAIEYALPDGSFED